MLIRAIKGQKLIDILTDDQGYLTTFSETPVKIDPEGYNVIVENTQKDILLLAKEVGKREPTYCILSMKNHYDPSIEKQYWMEEEDFKAYA